MSASLVKAINQRIVHLVNIVTTNSCDKLSLTLAASNLFLNCRNQNTVFFRQPRRQLLRSHRLHSSYTTAEMLNCLPFFACGEIIHGFGRGSKELGIPTANYPLNVVKSLPEALLTGIYYGWANVDNGTVYKMVMSIGWNPFYDNKEKSMETHIIHEFEGDLYGQILKVCIVGYLRPEQNFASLDELIAAIRNDIEEAKSLLDSDTQSQQLKESKFFKEPSNTKTKPTEQSNNHDDVLKN